LKNQNEKAWNISRNKLKIIKVKSKRKISFMKKRKNKKCLKIIHLVSKIMIIKNCSGHKYNKMRNLIILIIRNSCLDNSFKKFKEVKYINMARTLQGLPLNNLNLRIMILDLILISLRTRKKVLLWSSKNLKQNIFKLINYR
jgi:hypothetical protein